MRLKIKLKVIVDIFLLLAVIISAVTGVLLLLGPSGPGTQAGTSVSLFDFASRSSLKLFHDWSSILLIILIVFHLMLNWNIIIRYIRSSFVVSRK